jgi:hypothetical protein
MPTHEYAYGLAPATYVCQTADYVVLLDVASDRYLAITPDDARLLHAFVKGWPAPQSGAPTEQIPGDNPLILEKLLEQGLITVDRRTAKSATPVQIEPPQAALIDGYEDVPAPFWIADLLRVAHAAAATRILLRVAGLAPMIDRIRRIRSPERRRRHGPATFAQQRTLVARYVRIRPFVFTTHKECMLDSLVMCEFLASRGLFPHCVFGVRSSPFAAHCWVQQDGYVFNDTPEYVSKFTPILII